MTIEQAKEIFNIFLQDIEMNDDGNYILELRLNPDDTWSHFTPEDIKAFKMAFKSLEIWEKVIKEVEEETKDDNVTIFGRIFINGQKNILKRIKKYKKEIEK